MNRRFTIAFLFLLPGFFPGQSQTLSRNVDSSTQLKSDTTRKITYTMIGVGADAYGYDILVDGKVFIHQTTVPAVPGTRAFARKEDAEKVARLVVTKMEKGMMPPAVTRSEIEALGWQDQ
ncbi:MAG: DUF4907 domain-containing protein [Chryseosolibacter sp.]